MNYRMSAPSYNYRDNSDIYVSYIPKSVIYDQLINSISGYTIRKLRLRSERIPNIGSQFIEKKEDEN